MLRKSIDEGTIKRLNRDEAKAQKEVHDYFYPDLVDYSESFTGNYQASEEIASDTMQKLFNLPSKQFTDIGWLKNWLRRVTKNLSIDYLRKAKSQYHVPYDDSFAEDESECDQMDEFGHDVIHLVFQAIDTLPPQQKLIMQFKFLGYKPKQIADLLQVSVSTVNNHIHCAKKSIKKFLHERGKYPLPSDY
jgi:RNA polymerase sigma-70 factor (ECF subfamily)